MEGAVSGEEKVIRTKAKIIQRLYLATKADQKLTTGERVAFGGLVLLILVVWFCIVRMP